MPLTTLTGLLSHRGHSVAAQIQLKWPEDSLATPLEIREKSDVQPVKRRPCWLPQIASNWFFVHTIWRWNIQMLTPTLQLMSVLQRVFTFLATAFLSVEQSCNRSFILLFVKVVFVSAHQLVCVSVWVHTLYLSLKVTCTFGFTVCEDCWKFFLVQQSKMLKWLVFVSWGARSTDKGLTQFNNRYKHSNSRHYHIAKG